MPNHPMGFNLALIVHRLLTNPRGWRVEDLKDELAIADRTYRKYRRLLMEQFQPFQGRDGESLLREVEVGPVRYLRLVGVRETGISDGDFFARLTAAHVTDGWFRELDGTRFGLAFEDLVREFRSTLRDRSFVDSSVLAKLDERVVVEPLDMCDDLGEHIDNLLAAVVRSQPVRLEVGGGREIEGEIELLHIGSEGVAVRIDDHDEVVHLSDVVSVTVDTE